jgi:hypothetical protein
MIRITVDEVLLRKLHNLSEPLELCDNSGRVLGHFVPTFDLSKYEPWEPEFSEEELRAEEESNGKRYTTVEVLAHFKALEGR